MPPNSRIVERRSPWASRPITQAKKGPTCKSTLIADPARYIPYLGPTTCGSHPRLKMLKNELNINLGLLDLFALLADLNYLGLVRDYDVAPESLPHHKPQRNKKKPLAALNDAQRADSRAHARRRVRVEHTMAKRLGCIKQAYRNKSLSFNDRVMALACGIWNWHLTQKNEAI